MQPKLSKSEAFVARFLRGLQFHVSPITPQGSAKTADLSATDARDCIYLIEVESQAEDLTYWEELQRQGEVTRKDQASRTNVASRVIRHAAKQLLETPSSQTAFLIIAFVASDDDRGSQVAEFRATLYGNVSLVSIDESQHGKAIDCYFFDFNEFFELPQIEAALLFGQQRCQLCVNTFAHRSEEFRTTELYRYFDQNNGILDPSALERAGLALVANFPGSRRDENATIEALVAKYSLTARPTPIRPVLLSGAIRFDEPGNPGGAPGLPESPSA